MELFELKSAAEAQPYAELTYPYLRPWLANLGNDPALVAVAAHVLGQSLGLALGQVNAQAPEVGTVHSLYVAPALRGRGFGTALLQRAEAALRHRGCRLATLVYPTGKPTTPALERILAKTGWATPQRSMLFADVPIASVRTAPLGGTAPLPEPLRMVAWIEISDAQRRDIAERQESHPWIPASLVPDKWEQGAEPRTSLGLLWGDRVEGWLITHHLDADTLRYSCGWVRADLQRLAHARPFFSLLVDATRRADAAEYTRGVWYVSMRESPMASFTLKRLARWGASIRATMQSQKNLDPLDNQGVDPIPIEAPDAPGEWAPLPSS